MKTDFRVELTNKAEIKAMIDGLPAQFQSKATKTIIRDSTRPLIRMAQSLTPVSPKAHKARGNTIEPGTLKKSIGLMDMKRAKMATMIIGPRVKGAFGGYRGGWYGHMVEFDRKIVSRKSKMILGAKRGAKFMARAWEQGKDEVQRRFETDAVRVFERYVNRMKSKGKL